MAETWQAMWNIIKAKFPDAILTSSFRQGDPGYHGKGQAIDIARPYPAESARMLEYANWIGANYPNSTQLIHTPGPNILNGKPFTYDAPTQRDHYNHVHWAMATAPAPPKGGTVALASSSRGGASIIWVCLHTAEGSRTRASLYDYFNTNQNASSHGGADGTGLDDGWVPDERAAWTLLNGNSRSLNLEMCGFARWTRAQWLSTGTVDGVVNPRQMVRNAAEWARRKCERWGIPKVHIGADGVRRGQKGIIMHRDYTYGAGDGDHTDIGDGFPWDVFFSDMGASNGPDPVPTNRVVEAPMQYELPASKDDTVSRQFFISPNTDYDLVLASGDRDNATWYVNVYYYGPADASGQAQGKANDPFAGNPRRVYWNAPLVLKVPSGTAQVAVKYSSASPASLTLAPRAK